MLPSISPYVGPTARLEDMIYSSKVEDVPGLNVLIGESTLGYGLAMYLAVDDEVNACHVPKGSYICEYSTGRFVREEMSEGDKTVCFFFDTADAFVFYNDTVTSLVDCVLDTLGEKTIVSSDLDRIIAGHCLTLSNKVIKIIPDPLYTDRYYMPVEAGGINEKIREVSLGVYANDLAYKQGVIKNEADYKKASEGDEGMNVLSLLWKLVKSDTKSSSNLQTLTPIHPVLVTQRPLLFTNKLPMEVGLHYGFRYWEKCIS